MLEKVRVWKESVTIPSYGTGEPEKNPMFMEKRVYQGSSGVVYPYPIIEKILDEKTDKTYNGLFLENRYIKIMILPELGGRIQMAYDKIKKRHFVYFNEVIKPALVGLTGPWISGGIEFNWPQHHRPSTFEPVDFSIEENKDGSSTIWIHELERMFHTKVTVGFTLFPGKAFIEISARLFNPTPFPQTFLWWANPAVKVNEHYQTVFPPDVNAVYDHGKRDVSEFPIAKGEYYKVNYAPGTDISRYKNIPVPTSFMAVSSKYNFIGGYEHDSGGGILHIADHHVSPGKKQWTWGNGEFGKAWDRNLTDENGPYIEIMTGMYTDNQPDFSWLNPNEEKSFKQYFMPYSEVGVVKNASTEALVNLTFTDKTCSLNLYVTSSHEKLNIKLIDTSDNKVIFSENIASSPETPVTRTIALNPQSKHENILLIVTDVNSNRELIRYCEEKTQNQAIPSPALAPETPSKTANIEDLYLTGLHLEQYRHATYKPTDYYEEAIRRDPSDIRSNNALGLWYLRRGKPELAENYFHTAIKSITRRNPNPYDGEPYYNLGLSLLFQEKYNDAYDAFYKSAWNNAWKHAASLNLARISCLKGNYSDSLMHIETAFINQWHSNSARLVKTALLRKTGQLTEALALVKESLRIDHFNFSVLFEKYLILSASNNEDAKKALNEMILLMRDTPNNYLECSFEYAAAGLYDEAVEILKVYLNQTENVAQMVWYTLAWLSNKLKRTEECKMFLEHAASAKPDFCFPNHNEEILILKSAIKLNPADSKAPYYLGNLYFDKKQYTDAMNYWELSRSINPEFPTVHRNLALAFFNKLNDTKKSLILLEKAFHLDETDGRVFMELDQLYKKLNYLVKDRLKLFEKHMNLVLQRDDLYLEYITLINQSGNYMKAKSLLMSRKFHPWEGGEGKVTAQYLLCQMELAKDAIVNGDFPAALKLLNEAEQYPENLGEGKLITAQENDIHFLKAIAFEKLNETDNAQKYFQKSVEGISEPVQAIFYNDPQPDKIFYQGLGWLKLKETSRAIEIFDRLINFGQNHYNDSIKIDFFAVSLPDMQVFDADLDLKNRIHCNYIQGLGHLGKGSKKDIEKAVELFGNVLLLDTNHMGALIHLRMIEIISVF